MVDLRETLAAAASASRTAPPMTPAAAAAAEGAALAAWLRCGHAVSQKRRDAAALLRHLTAGGLAPGATPPGFAFERVQVWERFRAAADAADGAARPRQAPAVAA